jgi:branched-subunit amino acid transport protein
MGNASFYWPEEQDMIWIIMIMTGLFTFCMRFVMFSGLTPRALPRALEDALDFVPIAVLTAIIVPAVIFTDGNTLAIADNTRLPAAIIATVIALLTRSVVATIVAGLAALWTLPFIGL